MCGENVENFCYKVFPFFFNANNKTIFPSFPFSFEKHSSACTLDNNKHIERYILKR